jgi:hypothetical protein
VNVSPAEQQALAALRSATDDTRYSALIAIGKAGLRGLAPEIEPYLVDEDSELRSAAIRTLAFYWRMPEHRATAATMMRDEPDPSARAVAVMAWATYDLHANVGATLRRLYEIVIDDTQPKIVRAAAYDSFFAVHLPTDQGAPRAAMTAGRPVEDGFDWRRLDEAMRAAAADLPSEEDLARTRSIEYRDARFAVTFRAAEFELARDDRGWHGDLVAGAWERIVGALALSGFPAPAAPGSGDVVTVTCTRDDATEHVTVPAASSKYRDLSRLATAVASELVPELGPAGPSKLVATAIATREAS